MLRTALGAGAGFALGYCFPKLDALSSVSEYSEPVESALRKLLPKPKIELTYALFARCGFVRARGWS
jgi:hypothetical protein